MMHRYSYDGPVEEFGKCICRRWKSVTYAVSESKARSNLTYQFKKENNKIPSTRIVLPGKITLDERKEEHDEHRVQTELA